jgi:hypothetical protein
MTTPLEGGEWSAASPGRTLPPGKTRYPFYRRLGGPQGRSRRAEDLVPTGIWSRTVQLVVSRYTDWATRPTVSTIAQLFKGIQQDVFMVTATIPAVGSGVYQLCASSVPRMCQWCAKCVPVVWLWCSDVVPMVCQWRVDGVPSVCLWCDRVLPMSCQWCVKGLSMVWQGVLPEL